MLNMRVKIKSLSPCFDDRSVIKPQQLGISGGLGHGSAGFDALRSNTWLILDAVETKAPKTQSRPPVFQADVGAVRDMASASGCVSTSELRRLAWNELRAWMLQAF